MDILSLLRTMGALGVVLGLLAGALWIIRRYNIRLPGGLAGDESSKRVALVERVGIDARRSIALVRRDGREHLILIAPEGHLVIETAIVRDAVDAKAAEARAVEADARAVAAQVAAAEAQENFRELVANLVDRSGAVLDKVGSGVERLRNASKTLKPVNTSFRELVASVADRSSDAFDKVRGTGARTKLADVAPVATPVPKRSPAKRQRGKASPAAMGNRKRTAAKPRAAARKDKTDG